MDKTVQAVDILVVWVHQDGFNHWSGIAPGFFSSPTIKTNAPHPQGTPITNNLFFKRKPALISGAARVFSTRNLVVLAFTIILRLDGRTATLY